MKKFIITLCALIMASAGASAQGFLNFRVEAGGAFNFASVLAGDTKLDTKSLVGYHVGAFVDVPVSNGFYVGSGLKFSMKGAQYQNEILGFEAGAAKMTFHFLEIPVNVGYKFNLSPAFALALQTGPYFSVAMAGTVQGGSSLGNLGESYNIFKEGLTGLGEQLRAKRFDVGWGLAARAQFSRYYLTAGLDFGFLNVLNNSEKGTSISDIKDELLNLKNKQFYIGVGVEF